MGSDIPVPPVQDESNRSGGKWIIRLRKGLASRFWENIILAMLGEQFMVGEEICGAVVSIRFQVTKATLQYYYSTTAVLSDCQVVKPDVSEVSVRSMQYKCSTRT